MHRLSSCLFSRLVQGGRRPPEPGQSSRRRGARPLHGEGHQQAERCQDDEGACQRPG